MSDITPEPPLDLTVKPPNEKSFSRHWTLIAHNRAVLKSWIALAKNTPEDAAHCYDWLAEHAMRPKGQRCYALKGKLYTGCWAYEIGRGNRVYYRPNESTMTALIYYAGAHPNTAPVPPRT
jgi:hypothetical protein